MKNSPETDAASTADKKSARRENIEAIVLAVVLALFIRTFIVQAFKIPSGSMQETLQIGDHILVNKFIYGIKLPFTGITIVPIKKPKPGDIVVFEFPEDPDKDFIKRVIGVPGDILESRNKQIYVNGRPLKEAYSVQADAYVIPAEIQPRDNFGPIRIPEGKIFVMGDNRDHSYDSRWWGFVDMKALKGKAFIIYWSWDKEGFPGGGEWLTWWEWVRWKRLGKILH